MDTALDRAVRVFCERGYHATSIGDLTAAMRLATGSVYKAFRDKHAVFLAAFERYAALRREQTRSAAARGANGRERLRNMLLSYVEHSQGIEGRRGCIVVGSAVELVRGRSGRRAPASTPSSRPTRPSSPASFARARPMARSPPMSRPTTPRG